MKGSAFIGAAVIVATCCLGAAAGEAAALSLSGRGGVLKRGAASTAGAGKTTTAGRGAGRAGQAATSGAGSRATAKGSAPPSTSTGKGGAATTGRGAPSKGGGAGPGTPVTATTGRDTPSPGGGTGEGATPGPATGGVVATPKGAGARGSGAADATGAGVGGNTPAALSPAAATPPDTGAGFTTTPTTALAEVSGWVRTPDGGGRGFVPVAFWPTADGWSDPAGAVTVQSARSSRYTILLPDGAWTGAACGSPTGYAPLFWEVVVSGGAVVSYRERDDRMPTIDRVAIYNRITQRPLAPGRSPRAGHAVRIDGRGFGCSGRVLLLQAGQEVARVASFVLHTDGRVVLDLPAGGWDPALPLAFAYVHGRWRSGAVAATPAAGGEGGSPRTTFPGSKRR